MAIRHPARGCDERGTAGPNAPPEAPDVTSVTIPWKARNMARKGASVTRTYRRDRYFRGHAAGRSAGPGHPAR
ncbi:hypothetical protein GCM10027073_70150 [Streptomyces chlorus]